MTLPWYVLGPLFGLTVAGFYAVTNQPVGSTGAYAQVTDRLLHRPVLEVWRLWYMGGIIIGAQLAGWLRGQPFAGTEYGVLGRLLPATALLPLLFASGILMGYGSRWAGGCTAGHGLCGTSARSPGSFAATITFFATAIAVTQLLHWLTGGQL